jgi:hypothetical protein
VTKHLTRNQIDQIRRQKAVYLKAQELTGVPWQAIAAIHYREHSLSPNNPSRIGGPFQFDPPLTEVQARNYLTKYTNLGKNLIIDEYAKKGVNDFQTAAILAACHMRHKCKPVLNPNSSDTDIKDAMWGYNGRAYGSADKSPYVMNMYDKDHMNMIIVGTVPDIKNPKKRIRVRTVDKRPGSFTIYKEIKELGL